jgi:ABC-2 type transport system permease protein
LWRNLPTYRQFISLAAQIPFVYRVNWAMHMVTVVLQVYLLRMVWTAVYAGRGSIDQVGLDAVIAYLTLANLQWHLLWPFLGGFIQERVRDGKVAVDLARPVGFLGQMLALQIGYTAGTIPFVALFVPVAAILGAIRGPASPSAAALYFVSVILAYAIISELGLLLGLIAFWTLETGGFFIIYLFVNQFFAGVLVPLWFFPPALRMVANFLPFQSQAFVPISIYLGQLQGGEAAWALLRQAFWIVALYGIAWLVWRQALRRVVIQGG